MAKSGYFAPQEIGFGTPNTGKTPIAPPAPGVREGMGESAAKGAYKDSDNYQPKNS